MLVSVQVWAGVKALREWEILNVNSGLTVGEVFHGLSTGQIESADGFHLPEQYADLPVSCSIVPTLLGKFQSTSLSIKVQDAVEFGLKFVLQCSTVRPTTSKNALDVLMKEAGQLMWPDEYDMTRKNNHQQLHELQSRNASVVQKLSASMPQFHSRATRQSFIYLFGRVASVQPSYLREIYRQLTGDASAASSENEKEVDKSVRQVLDLEDAKVVVDLRHHNKSHTSKYEPFWEACE